jgi:hypothetical protein
MPCRARGRKSDRAAACGRNPTQFTTLDGERRAERTGEVMTTLGPVEIAACDTMATGPQPPGFDSKCLRKPTLSFCAHVQPLVVCPVQACLALPALGRK